MINGDGPFVRGTVGLPGWRERGVVRSVHKEVALGYCAGRQIELLGGFFAVKRYDNGHLR